MTDEIGPAGIYKPRRVRPLSREEQKDGDRRFREELAEESDLARKDEAAPRHAADRQPAEAAQAQAPSNVGRNLDVET